MQENRTERLKRLWTLYVGGNPMIENGVKLVDTINIMGYDAYIVGGSVRDLVLEMEPHDIDIATNAPMDLLEAMFDCHDIGQSKEFGILTIGLGGHQYEVSQFRQDGEYTDGRRPDSVQICKDFREDAARRDLTFNAMAIDRNGNILDFFGGIKSIHSKMVQTVGDPQERFNEDFLRILRAIRFAGKLGFDIDIDTINAIVENRWKLMSLSPERIKDELWKMASQDGELFARTLELMNNLGVLDVILPDVAIMDTFKETKRHHPEAYITGNGSVFSHTLAALRQSKINDPLVNMSILFHDIGKPVCHEQDGDRHTYFGHGDEGAPIIDKVASVFKLSKKERDAIKFAAVNHMKMWNGSNMKPSKIVPLVNDTNWELLKTVSWCDDSCRGENKFHQELFDNTINHMEDIGKRWGQKKQHIKVFDGNRVLQLTGLKPSKLVGDIVRAVTENVINNNVKLDTEIDTLILKYYKELK